MACKRVTVPGPSAGNGNGGGMPGFIEEHPGITVAAGGVGLAVAIRAMKGDKNG